MTEQPGQQWGLDYRRFAPRSLNRYVVKLVLATVISVGPPRTVFADWPAYHHDAKRSGITSEPVMLPLRQAWVYNPAHPPAPAWAEPAREIHRLDFDYAFQPVIAHGQIFFGSSSDDTIRAVHLDSGKLAWRYVTGGPIRFAPAVADGRVYVASDDGFLYCLDANNGELVWRFRAAPEPDLMLGNGRLISRWPLRNGVVVDNGTVYITAGMLPMHGIHLYALDAQTGDIRWHNELDGWNYMKLPHTGAAGFNGVACQGYLLVDGDTLLVPTARSVPAAIDRTTGKLRYYHSGVGRADGGTWCTIGNGFFINQTHAKQDDRVARREADPKPDDGSAFYNLATGERELLIRGHYLGLVSGDTYFAAQEDSIHAINLATFRATQSITQSSIWRAEHPSRAYSFAIAGDILFVGGTDQVTAIDTKNGNIVDRISVRGQARGLAVASGSVVVTTEHGTVTCFNSTADVTNDVVNHESSGTPMVSDAALKSAGAIVSAYDEQTGYVLVDGDHDFQLSTALATTTELQVIATQSSHQTEATLRGQAANVNAMRLSTVVVDDGLTSPLPPYFADMVVVRGAPSVARLKLLFDSVRPCGGMLIITDMDTQAALSLVVDAGLPSGEQLDTLVRIVRGPLPGAADWRFQWADSGQSGVSEETRIQLPFDVLWFGDVSSALTMNKMHRASTPLCVNGRVFMTGADSIIAFNAYNGRGLWTRKISDLARWWAPNSYGSFVADDDHVYVTKDSTCYGIDQKTGEITRTFTVPFSTSQSNSAPTDNETFLDVEWPQFWQVIGPFRPDEPVPDEGQLDAVPTEFVVGERTVQAKPLRLVNNTLDFSVLYGGYGLNALTDDDATRTFPRKYAVRDSDSAETLAYAFATLTCTEPGNVLIGAGADWKMKWYIDGELVYSTFKTGNNAHPPSKQDHQFVVELSAGDHVIAVVSSAGSASWSVIADRLLERPELQVSPPLWGYISVTENLVLGSTLPPTIRTGERRHYVPEASSVFAHDKRTGAVRWRYDAEQEVFSDNIVHDADTVFIIDGQSYPAQSAAKRRGEAVVAPKLVALDVKTGKPRWIQPDIPHIHCKTLQMRDGRVFIGGRVNKRDVRSAYNATDGTKLWQTRMQPQLATITADRLISPRRKAFDVKTGAEIMTDDLLSGADTGWNFKRSYGCSPIVGCQSLLYFRSGSAAFLDLETNGLTNFGLVRPGCSVTTIPAAGLALLPSGASGCTCSYNFQTSFALIPSKTRDDQWYIFTGFKGKGPVKSIFLNFGAPGDRRSPDGQPWLAFPRPTPLVRGTKPLRVAVNMDSPAYQRWVPSTMPITQTDTPWLYQSNVSGSGTITVALGASGKSHPYRVSLYFAEPDAHGTTDRVFDVVIQEKMMIENFDLITEANGQRAAIVKTFDDIEASSHLKLQLVAHPDKPPPVLCALAIRPQASL